MPENEKVLSLKGLRVRVRRVKSTFDECKIRIYVAFLKSRKLKLCHSVYFADISNRTNV